MQSAKQYGGNAIVCGLIGDRNAQILSPRNHKSWLQQYGIDGVYVPLCVQPADLAVAIRGLQSAGFVGINVTIPHKEAVYAWCQKHCDTLDVTARRIGAVNTLRLNTVDEGERTPTIWGESSDGHGFVCDVARVGWELREASVVVLGAGGASAAVIGAMLEAGVESIVLANRTDARAHDLAQRFADPRLHVLAWTDWTAGKPSWRGLAVEVQASLENTTLLVNGSPVGFGTSSSGDMAIFESVWQLPHADLRVYDLVYRAGCPTPLVAECRARNIPAMDGLGMLVYQATVGFAAWFGVMPEVTDAFIQELALR